MDARVVFGESDRSYTKAGLPIEKGERVNRLHFNIFNIAITRFDISCYEQKPQNLETLLITTKSNQVYIDLNECAEKFHVSKKKIIKLHEKDALNQEIKESRFKALNKIIDHYESAISCYTEVSLKNLTSKNEEVFTISKKSLMKIISLFHRTLHYCEKPIEFRFEYIPKTSYSHYFPLPFKILAYASKTNDYHLVNLFSKQNLGLVGTYGTIFKVQNIGAGTFSIIKESRVNYCDEDVELREVAYQSIKQEIFNLNQLKELSVTQGIQRPPFFSYREKSFFKKMCYVTHYYNKHDLFEIISSFKSAKERVIALESGFTVLISALNELHNINCINNDIKPNNILVEKDLDGKYHLCFGDMATLYQMKDAEEKREVDVHTAAYSPWYEDDIMLSRAELKAFDVYQLGSSIITAITGTPPYLSNPNSLDYPDFTLEFREELLLEVCSKEAVFLLKAMCNPNSNLRITIKDAFTFINNSQFFWPKLEL